MTEKINENAGFSTPAQISISSDSNEFFKQYSNIENAFNQEPSEPFALNELIDIKQCLVSLSLFISKGDYFEIRVLGGKRKNKTYQSTWSGVFNDIEQALTKLIKADLGAFYGTYFTLNPVNPDCFALTGGELVESVKTTIQDKNILNRKWILIDFDPERSAKISSNSEEKKNAGDKAKEVYEYLKMNGLPEPIICDSGNGYHLAYKTNLPNESGLLKNFLTEIASRFNNDKVKIDTSVSKLSQLTKLYGTFACKGANTPEMDRPWRKSQIRYIPEQRTVVTEDMIQSLINECQRLHAQKNPVSGKDGIKISDSSNKDKSKKFVQSFIDKYLLEYQPGHWGEYNDGFKCILKICPLNSEHDKGEAYIIITNQGKICFGCQHNSCKELIEKSGKYGWDYLKEKFNPNHSVIQEPKRKYGELVKKYGEPIHGKTINQQYFAAWYHEEKNSIFDPITQQFYIHNKDIGIWEKKDSSIIISEIGLTFHKILEEEQQPGLLSYRNYNNVNQIFKFLTGICNKGNVFNNRTKMIVLQNGILDMEGEKPILKPFSKEYYSRNRIDLPWDENATCDEFIDILRRMIPDEEDITLLQKYLGQCLLGRNVTQTFLMIQGNAGTGKSMIANLFREIIGKNNCAELRMKHIGEKFEFQNYIGKTLLFGNDVKSDSLALPNAEYIKKLVGGESIDAEIKYGTEMAKLHGEFNIIITSNSKQRVPSDSDKEAWRRRMIIICFKGKKPEKVIPHFHKELLEKYGSGILRWAVDGLRMLLNDVKVYGSIQLTHRQQQMVAGLLDESESVELYNINCLEEVKGVSVGSTELLADYKKYCNSLGWTPVDDRSFYTKIEKSIKDKFNIPKRNDVKREGKNVRGYYDLGKRQHSTGIQSSSSDSFLKAVIKLQERIKKFREEYPESYAEEELLEDYPN